MKLLSELNVIEVTGGQLPNGQYENILGARAYTQGQDCYINNAYQDISLAAHESQHIIQQGAYC